MVGGAAFVAGLAAGEWAPFPRGCAQIPNKSLPKTHTVAPRQLAHSIFDAAAKRDLTGRLTRYRLDLVGRVVEIRNVTGWTLSAVPSSSNFPASHSGLEHGLIAQSY
jgi:hypothetical protein